MRKFVGLAVLGFLAALTTSCHKVRDTTYVYLNGTRLADGPVVAPGEQLRWETDDPNLTFYVVFKTPSDCVPKGGRVGDPITGSKDHPAVCEVPKDLPDHTVPYALVRDHLPKTPLPDSDYLFVAWICKNCP